MRLALCCLLALASVAGAFGADAAVQRRRIVGLVDAPAGPAQVRARIRETTGVSVLSVRPLGPRQYGAVLACDSVAACDKAQARLAAATSWVRNVERDETRTLPTPPSAPAAR